MTSAVPKFLVVSVVAGTLSGLRPASVAAQEPVPVTASPERPHSSGQASASTTPSETPPAGSSQAPTTAPTSQPAPFAEAATAPAAAATGSLSWDNPPPPNPRDHTDYVAWFLALAAHGEGPNAWDLYAKLAEDLDWPDMDVRTAMSKAVMDPWDEKEHGIAVPWIEANQDRFEIVRQATKIERCTMPYTPDENRHVRELRVPTLEGVRIVTRAMCADGWRKFYQGDPEPLCRDICVMARIVHHLDAQPSMSIRKGPESFARMIYRDLVMPLLERSPDPGKIAKRLLYDFAEADPPLDNYAPSVMIEYAGIADDLQRIWVWDEAEKRYKVSREALDKARVRYWPIRNVDEQYIAEGLMKPDYVETARLFDEHYRKVRELAGKPYSERAPALDVLERDELPKSDNAYFLGMVKPLERDFGVRSRTISYQRGVHLMLAIWAFHEDNGRFPDNLDELKSLNLPHFDVMRRDEFTEGDVRYLKTEDGFKLYTIGEDGVDQEGTHHWGWGYEEPGDFVFWPIQERPRGPSVQTQTINMPAGTPAPAAKGKDE